MVLGSCIYVKIVYYVQILPHIPISELDESFQCIDCQVDSVV